MSQAHPGLSSLGLLGPCWPPLTLPSLLPLEPGPAVYLWVRRWPSNCELGSLIPAEAAARLLKKNAARQGLCQHRTLLLII